MADDKKEEKKPAPVEAADFYINLSGVDQAIPDQQNDYVIVPDGALVKKGRFKEEILKKAPWFMPFKGEVKKMRVVK